MNIEQFNKASETLRLIEKFKHLSVALNEALDTDGVGRVMTLSCKIEEIAFAIGEETYKKVLRLMLDKIKANIAELQNEFEQL